MLQCWQRTGHLPSFFVPTPGDLTAQQSPPQGICHPRQKKLLIPGGKPGGGGGWAQLELTDALYNLAPKIVIRVKHWLQTRLLLFWVKVVATHVTHRFKSNLFSPANPLWRSVVSDGTQTLRSGFDSYSRSSEFFPLKNWTDLYFREHSLDRNVK